MQVGLVADPQTPLPSSRGADAQTQATPSGPAGADETDPAQAQGAGAAPAAQSGGSSQPSPAAGAQVAQAGGGGGTREDIFAHAALPVSRNDASGADPAQKMDALFWIQVRRCLPHDAANLAGLRVAVTLDAQGAVAGVSPLDLPKGPASGDPQATLAAAIRACGPYRDDTLARVLTLIVPTTSAAAPA